MITHAGKFDQRIVLQNKVVTKNNIGEEVAAWIDYLTVWANYRAVSVQERFLGAQLQAEFDAVFRIRKLPDYRCALLDTHGNLMTDTNGEVMATPDCDPMAVYTNGIDAETRIKWRGELYELNGSPMVVDMRSGEMDLFVTRGIRDGR